MKRANIIAGNVMACILLSIVFYSILQSLFSLMFRDGRGLGLYGGRGEFYMSE